MLPNLDILINTGAIPTKFASNGGQYSCAKPESFAAVSRLVLDNSVDLNHKTNHIEKYDFYILLSMYLVYFYILLSFLI